MISNYTSWQALQSIAKAFGRYNTFPGQSYAGDSRVTALGSPGSQILNFNHSRDPRHRESGDAQQLNPRSSVTHVFWATTIMDWPECVYIVD